MYAYINFQLCVNNYLIDVLQLRNTIHKQIFKSHTFVKKLEKMFKKKNNEVIIMNSKQRRNDQALIKYILTLCCFFFVFFYVQFGIRNIRHFSTDRQSKESFNIGVLLY